MDTEAVSPPRPIAPSRRPPPRRFQGNSVTPLFIGEESLGRTRHYYFRRCKRMRPTNIHCLPNELLSEILARLPADHLHHRARLVCRRWYHIILSNAFIEKQSHHSAYGLLLPCLTEDPCRPIFVTATRAGQVESYQLSHKYTNRLLCSCNGFLLEMNFNRDLFIANPTTKQSLYLPPLQFPRMIPATCCCCMAFAASSFKYKIALAYLNGLKMGLAILTIGVDNSWRNVKTEHLPKDATRIFNTYAVTSEGFIHWPSRDESYMITMDVETEILTWRKLPLPKGYKELYFLSTGRFISMLISFGKPSWDIWWPSWEIWGLNPETGEWRKVLPDLDLGALDHEVKYKELVPIGWVNYPKVLAFGLSLKSGRTCILYNRETNDISSVELPQLRELFRCHVHRNNLRILC